jgi:hypothetical protein
MSGAANFPTTLDDDTSLLDVTDGVTTLIAAHHNNIKEAVKALEKKVGVEQTTSATSLDVRLGSPTAGHSHNGASGQGAALNASMFLVPSGGNPSGLTIADHMLHPVGRYLHTIHHGLPAAAANAIAPFALPRTMYMEGVVGTLRRGPSGATSAIDVNVGPTSMWIASQGLRPIFPPGATYYGNASANYMTVPSGVIVTVDVDAVGSNDPGQDLSVVFIFRE